MFKKYYDYSSDEEDMNSVVHEFNCEELDNTEKFKHGTVICKIICKMSSKETSIHFVKIPELGQQIKHILHGLSFINYQSNLLNTKLNIVVMTLGNELFR